MQASSTLNKVTLLIIILTFFVGDNVQAKFGISFVLYKFILVLLCCISIKKIRKYGKKLFPQAVRLLLFVVIYMFFKILSSGSEGNTMMGIIASLPVFIFLTFVSTTANKRQLLSSKQILYNAYILECCIAIIERLFYINIFQLGSGDDIILTTEFSSEEFRSIGLYGHPLQNALVVFVFIIFILIYEPQIKKKFLFAGLGILAIFCFNTRAAMVLSVLCFILYLFYWIKSQKVSGQIKLITVLSIFILGLIIVNLYLSGAIGGRLSSMGLYDDKSAATRVAAFAIFDYYDLKEFIIGVSYDDLQYIKEQIGLFAIENFWLNWLFSYGLLFVLGLIIFYIPFIKRLLKEETLLKKIYIVIPFIVLASTNPSLAVSIVPMTSFLLLSYIMPRTVNND